MRVFKRDLFSLLLNLLEFQAKKKRNVILKKEAFILFLMTLLKNKVLVITGASSGIGAATALAFAREGSSVVLAARRLERLRGLQEKIRAFGGNCFVVRTDVSRQKDVQRLFAFSEKHFGRVDILVNNAGVGKNARLLAVSFEDWKKTLETNLSGVFYCTQEAVKQMVAKNVQGHIITVSSVLGLIALPERSVYCASKHGVTGFQRSLRWELRKHGIRVSLVHPAGVDTEIVQTLGVHRKKWSLLRSEDVAETIVALATQDPLRIARARLLNFLRRIYSFVKYYPQ